MTGHLATCASFCTNFNPETGETGARGGCCDEHACWCPDGALSYAEWQERHSTRTRWANWAEARGYRRTRGQKVQA